MTTLGREVAARRPLGAALPGMGLVVLFALLWLGLPARAADALLPEARPDAPRAETQAEAAVAPVLAALRAPRTAGPGQQQAMLPSQGAGPSLSLMPYLDYLLDESGSLDIEEAAGPDRAEAYAPLALEKLPRTEAVMWLRFTLSPIAPGERPATLLLDMGESIPGTPMLYEPERNDLSGALEWRESSPAQRNVLLLPEAGAEPVTCYIRLDGLPGPWFSPMVRTAADAATNWGSLARTGAILALGVVMLLCLLRGLSENGQWRVWTALYVAVALGQALLGMPAAGPQRSMLGHAAATMAPGIALMLLPHVGRHLMRTRQRARGLDIQLLLLSLPGACLALLPLVPGWAWLDRWLDLWPGCTLLFVPTALGAWLMGLGGARRFLLGCLLPPLFVACGLLGLDFGIPPNLLASAPLWGTALSALLIAATGAPADMAAEAAAPKARAADAKDADDAGIINLDHPLDDPNLRLVSGGKAPAAPPPHGAGDGAGEGAPQDAGSTERARAEAREGALRAPLDDLLREGAALEQCALPPAVRQYASAMLDAARRMADVLSHADGAEGGTPGDVAAAQGAEGGTAFDLQRLLREAHGAVAPAAEYAGIGLAWYMPPHLGQLYRGDAQTLGETLGLLLESAVRATRQGAVHLSARRVPESSDPGNILFTVTDTGSGAPPRERSSLALARAWELAARHGGYVGMEYGPNGTTIAFSLHLEPLEDSGDELAGDSLPHVIIVADDPQQRRELSRMLADLPCRLSEAAGEHEALRRHEADPAVLLVAQGRYALPAAADMVARFMETAAEAGLSGCKVLAVTVDDSQWNLLADSGFTHALLEPVDADALRHTVRDVIRGVRRSRPAPQKTAPEGTETEAPGEPAPPEEGTESADAAPGLAEAAAPEAPEAEPEARPAQEAAPAQDTEAAGTAPVEDSPASVAETAKAEPIEPEQSAAPQTAEAPAGAETAAPAPEAVASPLAGDGQAVGELSGEEWHFLLSERMERSAAREEAPQAAAEPAAAEQGAEAEAGETENAGKTGAATQPEAEAPVSATPETTAPHAGGETADFFMEYAVEASPAPAGSREEQGAPAKTPQEQPAPAAQAAAEADAAGGAPSQPVEPDMSEAGAQVVPEPEPDTVPPAHPEIPRREAPPVTAGRASVYVSPALASPGEWVGEPMPIGTPLPRRDAGEAARPQAPAPGPRRAEEPRPGAPCPAQPARSGYTSPSVPVPGEWVGEPMPIPRKAPEPAPEEPAPAAGSDDGGSFMDFIVGATRVGAPSQPAPDAAPGGVTDFVERSVSLVTSAVSSALAPGRSEGRAPAAGEAAASAPTAATEAAPPAPSPDAGGPDAAILALVERLDEAMGEAIAAHAAGRGQMVAQAACAIAEESESFGFRVLARMARCVERAGRAGDMNALRDLLPELEVSVERNRIALTQRR